MSAKRAAGDDGEAPVGSPGTPESTAPARAVDDERPVPEAATPARPAKRRLPSAPVIVLIAIAAVLLVGVAAFAWWVFGTTWLARGAAADTVNDLRAGWAASSTTAAPSDDAPDGDEPSPVPAPARPAAGEAAWILTIPAIGLETPILSGVADEQLTGGVGWYSETALPGQVGNFAVAGLRITGGEPFAHLLDLQVGDEVVVETAAAVFTYVIIAAPADLTVQADESWVLDPVPGEPDTVPSQALVTLTTQEDLITTPDRSVGFGTLQKAEVK